MKQKSWACTLITQLCLCVAVYVALNIGHPQRLTHGNISSQGRPVDFYFITVAGGFRPLEEQKFLLQQIVKAAKAYKARFVVGISKLGGSDPLLQNATMIPMLQRIPWYTMGALEGQEETYFFKKFEVPNGQTLDIIALDTMLFQDMSSVHETDQIMWLTRTLNESCSDWRIAVGYHKLISCDTSRREMEEGTGTRFGLQDILLLHGVDAYISMKICSGHLEGDVAMGLSVTRPTGIGPCLNTSTETGDSFMLHRISSLKMTTFVVKSTGEVEQKMSFPQKGRSAM